MNNQKLISGLIVTSALFGALFVGPAMAKMSLNNEQCDVALNYDIRVEPKKMSVSEKGVEQYRVEMGDLYVQGKAVSLNAKQAKILGQYTDSLGVQVPEAVALVSEVMIIVNHSVTMALSPILGEQGSAPLDKMMQGIQKRVDTMAYREGDTFYLGATESSIEDHFNQEFEQEMEQMITSSMGSLMMTIGAQILSSEGGSFEEKMTAFSQKMENVGNDIEHEMESQSKTLEVRANKLCDNLEGLMVLEKELHLQIPQLAPYVIASNNSSKK